MLFILSLLWYASQKENNPFSKKDQLSVVQKDGTILIALIPATLKNNSITVVTPQNSIPCLSFLNKTSSWVLISCNSFIESFCTQVPPRLWTSIDTTIKSLPPKGWPAPVILQNAKDFTSITAKTVPVFSDGTTGIHLQIKGCNCLIINNNNFSDEFEINQIFKENIGLLVVVNQNPEMTKILRTAIRPSYLITTASPDSDLKKLSNIYYLNDSISELNFKIQTSQKLTLF